MKFISESASVLNAEHSHSVYRSAYHAIAMVYFFSSYCRDEVVHACIIELNRNLSLTNNLHT